MNSSQPLIEIRDLTKTYRMGNVDVEALRGVSLKVYRGEMMGIMGPSGSGKSTLMNILGALDVATSGTYLLDGLDVSRLNQDQLAEVRNRQIGFVFQSFNLLPRTTALANVVEQIKPMAGERQILIEMTGDTRLAGDPDRLRQVLLNLLDNAIRFTDARKGVVRVVIAGADNRVRLRVTDNGSGIPPEARAHIFERFYRVDKARARSSGGSGLGLAIVKAIVEAHGGTLRAESNGAEGGSVFEAVLPREPVTSTPKTA